MELVECDKSWPLPKLDQPHLNIDDILVPNFYVYIGIMGASRLYRSYRMHRSLIGMDIYSIKNMIGNNILK